MAQLHSQDCRLKRVQPLVAPDGDVLVLPALAEIAQDPDLVGELVVVGDDSPGVAVRSEVLTRVEAEGRDVAERPHRRPRYSAPCACAASSTNSRPCSSHTFRRPSASQRMAEQVDTDHRAGLRRHGGVRLIDVDLAELVAVDEHGTCPKADQRQHRRYERVGRREHLVCRADADRFVGEVEGRGARGDTDAVLGRRVGRPLLLEVRHLTAQDVLGRGDHLQDGLVHLVLDGLRTAA